MFLLFIINLYVFRIFKSEITLNFERQYDSYPFTKENLFSNLFYNYLIVKINIGSDKQEIPLMLKFYEYNTFIIGIEVPEKNLTKFNNNTSSTFKYIKEKAEFYVMSRFEFAYQSEDSLYLNNKEYKNYEFLLVKALSETYKIYKLIGGGVIGLNKYLSTSQGIDKYHFISMLKEKNYIDSYSFTFKFLDKNKGQIILGNEPHEYDKNYKEKNYLKIRTQNINDNLCYSIVFDNIISKNFEFNEYLKAGIVLENGFIISVKKYKDYLDDIFFNEKMKEGIWDKEKKRFLEFSNYLYLYSCDETLDTSKIPDLTFELKQMEMNFTFNEKDLWFNFDGRKYFLIIFQEYGNYWILGEPFLRKYQIIFNQDDSTLGYYNLNYKKPTSFFYILNWIFVILLFIIVLCLGAYIFIILKNKPKRKIANELIEEEYKDISKI